MEIITLGKIGCLQRLNEDAVRAFYDAETRQNPIIKNFVIAPIEASIEGMSKAGPEVRAEELGFGPLVLKSTYVEKRRSDQQTYDHLVAKLAIAKDHLFGTQTGVRHFQDEVWVNIDKYKRELESFRGALDGFTVRRKYEVPESEVPERWNVDLGRDRAATNAADIVDFITGKAKLKENAQYIGDFKEALIDILGVRKCPETTKAMLQLGGHVFVVQAIPSVSTSYSKTMDGILDLMTPDGLFSQGLEVKNFKGIKYVRAGGLLCVADRLKKSYTTNGNMRYDMSHVPC